MGAVWKRRLAKPALALALVTLLVGPGCLVIIPADGCVPQVEIRRPLIVPCTPVPPIIVVPPCVTPTPAPTCPTAAAAREPVIIPATPQACVTPTMPPCPTAACP